MFAIKACICKRVCGFDSRLSVVMQRLWASCSHARDSVIKLQAHLDEGFL